MLLVEYTVLDKLQVINEGTKGNKRLKVVGKFQKCDEQNNNGRVYPRKILESQVKAIQEKIGERSLVGALDHPANDAIHLSQASHLVTKLWVEKNGDVMGEAEILSTPNGKIVEALLQDDVKIGISSRGLGSVSEGTTGKVVNEDFKLITFDLVSDPSTKGAFPSMCESMRENSERAQAIVSKHKKDRVLMTMLESKIKAALGKVNETFELGGEATQDRENREAVARKAAKKAAKKPAAKKKRKGKFKDDAKRQHIEGFEPLTDATDVNNSSTGKYKPNAKGEMIKVSNDATDISSEPHPQKPVRKGSAKYDPQRLNLTQGMNRDGFGKENASTEIVMNHIIKRLKDVCEASVHDVKDTSDKRNARRGAVQRGRGNAVRSAEPDITPGANVIGWAGERDYTTAYGDQKRKQKTKKAKQTRSTDRATTDHVKASNARMTGNQEHWRGQKSGAPYPGGRDEYSGLEGSAKGDAYANMLRKRDASNKRNADIVRQAKLHEPTKKQDSTEIVKTDRMISFKESISKAVNTYLNETGDTKRRNKAAKRKRDKAKGRKNPDITLGQTVAARKAAKHEPKFSGAATVRAGREATKAEDAANTTVGPSRRNKLEAKLAFKKDQRDNPPKKEPGRTQSTAEYRRDKVRGKNSFNDK